MIFENDNQHTVTTYIKESFADDELYKFILSNPGSKKAFEKYTERFHQVVALAHLYTNADVTSIYGFNSPQRVLNILADKRLLEYIGTDKLGKKYTHSVLALYRIGLVAFALDILNLLPMDIALKVHTTSATPHEADDAASTFKKSNDVTYKQMRNFIKEEFILLKSEEEKEKKKERQILFSQIAADRKVFIEIMNADKELKDADKKITTATLEITMLSTDLVKVTSEYEATNELIDMYRTQIINNQFQIDLDKEERKSIELEIKKLQEAEQTKGVMPHIQVKQYIPRGFFKGFFKEVGEDIGGQEISIEKDNHERMDSLQMRLENVLKKLDHMALQQLKLGKIEKEKRDKLTNLARDKEVLERVISEKKKIVNTLNNEQEERQKAFDLANVHTRLEAPIQENYREFKILESDGNHNKEKNILQNDTNK